LYQQGDQLKILPKRLPKPFVVKINMCITFTVEKAKIWDTSVIKKLPKENNRPMCENLPNLVTLVVIWMAGLSKDDGVASLAHSNPLNCKWTKTIGNYFFFYVLFFQGDQLGRIVACCAIVNYGQYFKNYGSSTDFIPQ
jgi:hypothetical protein